MANNIIKLSNGSEVILDEWIHWDTFSTMEFAGQQKVELSAFRYTVGQQVPSTGLTKRTATETDTNMVAKGRVNNDEELIVFGLTHEIFALSDGAADPTVYPAAGNLGSLAPGVSVHNYRVLQHLCMVEFFVGAKITKPQIRAHFASLGQSIGPTAHGTVNPAGNVFRSEGTSGRVSANNQWKLELPMSVESDRMVHLKFFSPRAMSLLNQDIQLRWHLDALKRRPFG